MVKTTDCGSVMRGFESHHPPHFRGIFLKGVKSMKKFIILVVALFAIVTAANAEFLGGFIYNGMTTPGVGIQILLHINKDQLLAKTFFSLFQPAIVV